MMIRLLSAFFTAAICIVQIPAYASGVDFKNMTYASTPCGSTPAQMRGGHFTYDARVSSTGSDLDATIEKVSEGTVSGNKLAVVVFQCAPPKGCYNAAHAYLIVDSKPVSIQDVGTLYDGCPDPVTWFHVHFTPRFLYADVRSQGDNWIVTTYRWKGNKLVKVFSQHHKMHVPQPE